MQDMTPRQVSEAHAIKKITTVFIVVVIAGVFVSTTNLGEILVKWAPVSSLVESTASVVPSVNQLARQSRFPEVTRVVFSLAWLAQPLLFVIFVFWLLRAGIGDATMQKYRRHRFTLILGVLLLVPSGIAASWFLIGNEPIPDSGGTAGVWIERGMIYSRFILGLVVSLIALANALMAALAINFLVNLRRLFADPNT
jgi:hypothetical protein